MEGEGIGPNRNEVEKSVGAQNMRQASELMNATKWSPPPDNAVNLDLQNRRFALLLPAGYGKRRPEEI